MTNSESVGPIVRIQFTLTLQEFRLASRNLQDKPVSRLRRIVNYSVAMALIILVLWTLIISRLDHMGWDGWFCMGLILLLLLWSVASPFIVAWSDRKRWQAATELRGGQTFVFSPAGLSIKSTHSEFNSTWKHIVAAKRVHALFLLQNPDGRFYIVPERAFETPEDLRTFQQLLEAMAPKCKF